MFVVSRADEGVLGCFTTKRKAKAALLELEPKMEFQDAGEGFAWWYNPNTGVKGYIEDFAEDEWGEDIDYSFIDERDYEVSEITDNMRKLINMLEKKIEDIEFTFYQK